MQDKPENFSNKSSPEKCGLCSILLYFLFLVILPLATFYVGFERVQINLEAQQQRIALEEMSEITAHMTRLTNPETYFQDKLKRLSDSFRWASSTQEIDSLDYNEAVEIFLFDSKGKRLTWHGAAKGKIRISENFLELLTSLKKTPGRVLSRREQAIAASFSGNSATLYSLSRSIDTLINFQGLGLRKYGAWFRPRLYNGKRGHLLAFIEPDKIGKHHLAEKAIRKIQSFTGTKFRFAWLDLNNPDLSSSTGHARITGSGKELLSLSSLKSGFKFENHLFSINDTLEGIRLICSRKMPQPPMLLENYRNSLFIVVPVVLFFLIWKTIFGIKLNLSVSMQFSLVFGYTALTGILVLLSGITAFQLEKQSSLIANRKHQAIKILEKIDRNFMASYGDLLRQYRHLTQMLREADSDPKKVLQPLKQAYEDDSLSFASYCNSQGQYLFQAPEQISAGDTSGFEAKYARLINNVSLEVIKTFNSSRQSKAEQTHDLIGVTSISAKPIEGLLHNRSQLQNITFDGDETMTFMDLAINASDTATGCLFVVHRPDKLQLAYLGSSGQAVARTTGFELVAFPKTVADKSQYFPRYSMINELPLWKLQDLVSQTQVSGFKIGRIGTKEVLVAATPGHNLRNFNLFLIMPLNPIKSEASQLTMLFLLSTILALVFIAFLSGMLVRSLINPIHHLAHSALALTGSNQPREELASIPEGNELESIATGLADLIIKVREFNEGRSIKRHLLPPKELKNNDITCDGFQISTSKNEREIYHFASLNEHETLLFFMRTNLTGIEGSLNLSMARMSVRLISEELNVNSSYHILKDMEEYFRINLRRHISGDFFLGIFNSEQKSLKYSGCGGIKALIFKDGDNSFTNLEIAQGSLTSKDFQSMANQESDFSEGSTVFVISPAFSENCGEKIGKIINKHTDATLKDLLEKMKSYAEEDCSHGFNDAASFLVASNRNWKISNEE